MREVARTPKPNFLIRKVQKLWLPTTVLVSQGKERKRKRRKTGNVNWVELHNRSLSSTY